MPSIILWENWSYPFSVFGLVTTLHSQALMLHEQLANKTSHILLLFDIDHWIGKSLRKILLKLEKGNCTLFNLLKHYMDWKKIRCILVYIYLIIYHQNKNKKANEFNLLCLLCYLLLYVKIRYNFKGVFILSIKPIKYKPFKSICRLYQKTNNIGHDRSLDEITSVSNLIIMVNCSLRVSLFQLLHCSYPCNLFDTAVFGYKI